MARADVRKLIADLIISLDGYFTSLKNEIDWFEFGDEEWEWSKAINRKVDTMLLGRVTYEEFSQFWPTEGPKKLGLDPSFTRRLNELKKVVFSRTLADAPWKPVRLIREDPRTAVSKLKRQQGRDMVVAGSGSLVAALLQNGLIDEYFMRIQPIILGAGRPIFTDAGARHPLKLVSAVTFKSGVVAAHYKPRP